MRMLWGSPAARYISLIRPPPPKQGHFVFNVNHFEQLHPIIFLFLARSTLITFDIQIPRAK